MLRTCFLYLLACWILMQVVDILFPVIGLEAGLASLYLLSFTLILFPVIIVLAWFYQITPQGISRSSTFTERRLLNNLVPLNERRSSLRAEVLDPSSYNWALTGESGPLEGLSYAIVGPLVLGRTLDCDLALVNIEVSRHHARLSIEDGLLMVKDLNSANGTAVNGVLIEDDRRLNHGDVLEIQDIQFRISESFHSSEGPLRALNQDTVMR